MAVVVTAPGGQRQEDRGPEVSLVYRGLSRTELYRETIVDDEDNNSNNVVDDGDNNNHDDDVVDDDVNVCGQAN